MIGLLTEVPVSIISVHKEKGAFMLLRFIEESALLKEGMFRAKA